VVLTVADRGPWHTRFGLDLSKAAFRALGLHTHSGWGWVTVEKVNA
jgi:rare lipoprotein A (peptidoglycan hydrolase)